MKQEVVAVDRVLQAGEEGYKWNNKKITWSIEHNFANQTKHYDIELEMVLVSSKRILKVNGEIKNTQMRSFGYEANFQISEKLKGYIKQDGLTYQLYVNGVSFTKLKEYNEKYQPPKVEVSTVDSLQLRDSPKKETSSKFAALKNMLPNFIISPSKSTKTNQIQQTQPRSNIKQLIFNQTNKTQIHKGKTTAYMQYETNKTTKYPLQKGNVLNFDKKSTQNVIKDTQNQLLKILKQQKRKKQEQQLRAKQGQWPSM